MEQKLMGWIPSKMLKDGDSYQRGIEPCPEAMQQSSCNIYRFKKTQIQQELIYYYSINCIPNSEDEAPEK